LLGLVCEVAVMDGMLLQSVEALGDSPLVGSAGEIWEMLQAEKEEVSRDILSEGPLLNDDLALNPVEAPDESVRQIEWHYRETLLNRLRTINDAQDRLLDGGYGVCIECGGRINTKRLLADPAVLLCLTCQGMSEGETFTATL
jgi:RNA polymerase-binding transcription factor DksA